MVNRRIGIICDAVSLGDSIDCFLIYLKRIAMDHEIPFKITAAPRVNQETIDAIAEGHRLAKDPNAPVYHDIKSLFEALDS